MSLQFWLVCEPCMLYFLRFNIVAGEAPAGWMPAFCLTVNSIHPSAQAATCSYDNNSSITVSWRVFDVSEWALSRSPTQLCYSAHIITFHALNARVKNISYMSYLISAPLQWISKDGKGNCGSIRYFIIFFKVSDLIFWLQSLTPKYNACFDICSCRFNLMTWQIAGSVF